VVCVWFVKCSACLCFSAHACILYMCRISVSSFSLNLHACLVIMVEHKGIVLACLDLKLDLCGFLLNHHAAECLVPIMFHVISAMLVRIIDFISMYRVISIEWFL